MDRVFKLFVVLAMSVVVWAGFGPREAECKKIAVMWVGKSIMVNTVFTGFNVQKNRIAPDLEVESYKEIESMEEADKIFKDCESRVDGIVFLASPGADYLAKKNPSKPCFIGACNDPASLGVVKDLNSPEGNITGVTYFIPMDKKFGVLKELFPSVRSVALLLTKGHPSSNVDQKSTKEHCDRLGISYHEVWASDAKELDEGLAQVIPKVQLVIISTSRVVMDNMPTILKHTNPAKIPVFSYARKPVLSGATAGLVADDVKLGGFLADSVVDVVVRGKPVAAVPVKMDRDPVILVNDAMMKQLKLNFPDRIMQKAEIVK